MSNTLRAYFVLGLVMLGVTGCKEPKTYAYFMQHPAQLQKATERCELRTKQTSADVSACADIKRAATDFAVLVNEQMFNPEGFGKTVLKTEQECAEAKKKMLQLSPAEKQYEIAKTLYEEKDQQTKILLAVIGTHSPE
jgi:hypothetical protein